jgi:hypothetical protein
MPIFSSTECPQNTTIVPTIAATRPQQNQANNENSLLKRLATTHYQSYTTALTVTIGVGCFLLLLNVFIFAAIYYQREKRANYTKKKEELTEVENLHHSPSDDHYVQKASRKSSLQSVSGTAFGEYSCYEEKINYKEKRHLVDLCAVELPMNEYKCSSQGGSNTGSLRRSVTPSENHRAQHHTSHENLTPMLPPTYSSQPPSVSDSSSNTTIVCRHIHHPQPAKEHCNQATQSDPPDLQDIGTIVDENDVELSPGIPDPPPPPRHVSTFQGGILRQQGGPATPGTAKKRVQIQEISV